MIDRKGIAAFLLLTFGITFAYEGMLIVLGVPMNVGAPTEQPLPPPYWRS